MSAARGPGAVVVGGSPTGLEAARALARHGVPVALIVTRSADIAQYSRRVAERRGPFDLVASPGSLIEFLEREANRWRGWAILADGDLALRCVAGHHERLASSYALTTPPWDTARCLIDKGRLYAAAREVGVDLPHDYGDATAERAGSAAPSYPVVVKPLESEPFVRHFGRKLLVARDRDELLRHVTRVEAAGLRARIFDLVPGPDRLFYNYSVYIDARGQPAAELGMHKLRKSPPFYGVCRVGEVANLPQLREATIECLRRVGWRGMANAEYKLDPRDGRYRLMEINGRCFLMQGLARRAGVNYPLLAWREAVAGEVLRATPRLWPGVWVDLLDDVWYGALFRRREGLTLADYAASYRRPKAFAVWSAADPLPFLVRLGRLAVAATRILGSRRLRAALQDRVTAMPGLGDALGDSPVDERRPGAPPPASALRPGGDRSRMPAPRGPSAPAR